MPRMIEPFSHRHQQRPTGSGVEKKKAMATRKEGRTRQGLQDASMWSRRTKPESPENWEPTDENVATKCKTIPFVCLSSPSCPLHPFFFIFESQHPTGREHLEGNHTLTRAGHMLLLARFVPGWRWRRFSIVCSASRTPSLRLPAGATKERFSLFWKRQDTDCFGFW